MRYTNSQKSLSDAVAGTDINGVNAPVQIINFTGRRPPGKLASVNTHDYRKFIATWAVVAMAIIAIASAAHAQDKAIHERIGVYDSRAVTVAYAGSAQQMKKMKALTTLMKKARDAGDTNQIARLEVEGRAWQANLHQRGFGTAPVEDLLLEIAGDFPAIEKAAGVTRFISKWDKAELDRHPRSERIDITKRLVDAIQPNETQRRRAIEIQKMKPQKIRE
jgi:hypothetical protein